MGELLVKYSEVKKETKDRSAERKKTKDLIETIK